MATTTTRATYAIENYAGELRITLRTPDGSTQTLGPYIRYADALAVVETLRANGAVSKYPIINTETGRVYH